MNFGAWLGTERKRVHTENIFILAAQVILHNGNFVAHSSCAQRHIEYRTQMLLKLTGYRTFLGPVSGIVRAHREFINVEAC